MTTRSPCPEPSVLSGLLDGEFESADESGVRIHISACDRCRRELSRLERAADLSAQLQAAAPSFDPASGIEEASPACLSPEDVTGLVAESLEKDDEARVELHLATCDSCLREVAEAFQMRAYALETEKEPVPPALAARVASRWKAEPRESISEVVIRAARGGLELVRRTLAAPIVSLEPIAMAAPAFRSGEPGEVGGPLRFRLQASAATIEATVLTDGSAMRLDLVLRDPADTPLAGQRVHLRQRGRSIFSARTDETGALHMPRLDPGVYEVYCSGIETSFRLDLGE